MECAYDYVRLRRSRGFWTALTLLTALTVLTADKIVLTPLALAVNNVNVVNSVRRQCSQSCQHRQ
jgi:hypothetical protein